MKVYDSAVTYDYSFPTVSLAYFLRYPNPYSRHVLSTDVIERYIDPATKRLHTTRLHLKRSKVPTPLLRFLPKGSVEAGGAGKNFIVETSVVDPKEGWMETSSRNMEFTGVLSVIERQKFERRNESPESWTSRLALSDVTQKSVEDTNRTFCKTTVTFVSHFGMPKARKRKRIEGNSTVAEEEPPKQGFFASLSSAGVQRTIELVGVKRAKQALTNGNHGMNVVLERLRSGGIRGVFEGIRQDVIEGRGPEGGWKQVWMNGTSQEIQQDSPDPHRFNDDH